jgi:Phosphate transporter family
MIRARRGGGSTAVEAAFVLAVVAALAFAFTNGFHDAANAIATLVATRGASPGAAIALAAVFNLLGPLLLGAAVANTIATMTSGKGSRRTGRRPSTRGRGPAPADVEAGRRTAPPNLPPPELVRAVAERVPGVVAVGGGARVAEQGGERPDRDAPSR